ncbi:MAG: glycosyltransferase family 2 protein [Ktedonobacteraceae bacterium]|nr:glycosyltransferase family 2 protein [Ktedonobacteraceae bacterium]
MHYTAGTLGHEIMMHQNAYGFDADQVVEHYRGPLPSASIVLPFYNARRTIHAVIGHLLQAISVVTSAHPHWRYEIILIDDGSERYPAAICLGDKEKERVCIEVIPHQGRCFARNHALSLARNHIIIFIDADVLLHPSLLLHHLTLQAVCEHQGKGCISFSLFDFHPLSFLPRSSFLVEQPTPNDWRLCCVYQEAWYGCEQDKCFAGRRFQPLADTDMLRKWPSGLYGPWMLPNMVLGGFFTVAREKALAVGGCDPLFPSYSFEETSLITKVIASFHDYVIPLTRRFALHLEDTTIGETRDMKYALFRKAHQRYFEVFLAQPWKFC